LCDYNTNISGNGKVRLVYSDGADVKCSFFQNTSDVVPRSEVELLKADNEQLTINMNAYGLTAKRLAEENESLEIELENMRRNLGDAREGWNDAECEVERLESENERLIDLVNELQEYNEAWVEDNGKQRKENKNLAREIFAEIDTMLFGSIIPNDCAIISIAKLAELKKKYTEDQI
jgi:chromosome segregation ATPase